MDTNTHQVAVLREAFLSVLERYEKETDRALRLAAISTMREMLDKLEQFDPQEGFSVSKEPKKLRLDWVGGLKELRDHYTSLELQKEAVEDWTDS